MYHSSPSLEGKTLLDEGGKAMVMTEKKAEKWTEQGEEDLAVNPTLLSMSVGINFFCTMEVIVFFTQWLQALSELICETPTHAKA